MRTDLIFQMDSSHRVLQSLDSHAVVLEAELREIRDDLHTCHVFTRKYGMSALFSQSFSPHLQTGSYFNDGILHVHNLREDRERRLAEISHQKSLFTQNVMQGQALLQNLGQKVLYFFWVPPRFNLFLLVSGHRAVIAISRCRCCARCACLRE